MRIWTRGFQAAMVIVAALAVGCDSDSGGSTSPDASTTGTDATDATDGADGNDATDGADGNDATDGTDGGDATDGADGGDATDGTDGGDATDGADGGDGFTPTFADAQGVFEDNCTPCHEGDTAGTCSGGTCFVSLYEEATKQNSGNYAPCDGLTVAECGVLRIKDGSMPLGGGTVPQADLDLLEAWIDAGLPQ